MAPDKHNHTLLILIRIHGRYHSLFFFSFTQALHSNAFFLSSSISVLQAASPLASLLTILRLLEIWSWAACGWGLWCQIVAWRVSSPDRGRPNVGWSSRWELQSHEIFIGLKVFYMSLKPSLPMQLTFLVPCPKMALLDSQPPSSWLLFLDHLPSCSWLIDKRQCWVGDFKFGLK